jgi:hypothetical protein
VQYVALESFVDPSNGAPVVAGQTQVDGSADVYRMFPSRFREIERDEARGGSITRTGGTGFVGKRQRAPKHPARESPWRPYWQLGKRKTWRLR